MTTPSHPLLRSEFTRALLKGRFEELVGRRLGPFRIVREMSCGGMGVVFRAVHEDTGQAAAIKLLLTDEGDPDALTRFEREARVLLKLEHPNIVKLLGYGCEDQLPWIAMELVSGVSLEEVVLDRVRRGEAVDYDWVRSIFIDLAGALALCHSRGVVHRDVKPSNIVLSSSGQRAVLVDFGLVKLDPHFLRQSHESLVLTRTQTKDGVGTPTYMAPEQLDPSGDFGPVSAFSDTWSLGATLFFTVSAETPYGDINSFRLFAALLMSKPRLLRTVVPDTPRWLEEVCARCLLKKADQRPNMKELGTLLREAKRSRKPMLRALAAICVFVFVVLVALFLIPRGEESLGELRFPKKVKEIDGEWWTQSPLSFRGRAPSGVDSVQFGGLDFSVNRDGFFQGDLVLESGTHELLLSAGGFERRYKVQVDNDPPKIELDAERWGDYYLVESGARLTGRLIDWSPCQLTFESTSMALTAKKGFEIELPKSNGLSSFELRGTDALGQTTRLVAFIVDRDQLKRVSRQCLRTTEKWRNTPKALQDMIIAGIDRRLGPGYRWRRTKLYKNPGSSEQPLRIATYQHLKTKIELQLIPGGRFLMGTDDYQPEMDAYKKHWTADEFKGFLLQESPRHNCTVSPFLMGRLEVQQSEWDSVSGFPDKRSKKSPGLPLDGVQWLAIKNWLASVGEGLRLPSESEWEYACRAGTKTRFYWGDSLDFQYVWQNLNSHHVIRETRLRDSAGYWNGFGLVDSLGNVAEFCEDIMKVGYSDGPYDSRPRTAVGTIVSYRVIRGGGVGTGIIFTRAAARDYLSDKEFHPYCGFRVARSLPR